MKSEAEHAGRARPTGEAWRQNWIRKLAGRAGFVVITFALALGQANKTSLAAPAQGHPEGQMAEMDRVYGDESHCLTSADMRGDKDNPISCYCRDSIAQARYVYFTYVSVTSPRFDRNLAGVFLTLQKYAGEVCSQDAAEGLDMGFIGKIQDATTLTDWKWDGPEIVRTYPPDDAIKRIKPSGEHGSGRWVPFTVQLIYRDAQGRVSRTEEYSSREFIPVFHEKP